MPWHRLIFCPAPKVSTYVGLPEKKTPWIPSNPRSGTGCFYPDWRQWVGKSYNNDESVIKPEVHVVQPKLLACMLHFAIIWEISVIKSTFTFAISMHHLEDLFICYGHNQCTTQQISYVVVGSASTRLSGKYPIKNMQMTLGGNTIYYNEPPLKHLHSS